MDTTIGQPAPVLPELIMRRPVPRVRPPRRGLAWILALIPPRASKAWRMVSARLTHGALAVAVTVLAAAIVGCGQESPAVVAGPDQGAANSPGGQGATVRVGPFVEVIGARIPARRPGRRRHRSR